MDITGNDIGIIKDIIMSIAASITAWVAYSGLNKKAFSLISEESSNGIHNWPF